MFYLQIVNVNYVRISMKNLLFFLLIVLLGTIRMDAEENIIGAYCKNRIAEFDKISEERKLILDEIRSYVVQSIVQKDKCQLLFVCTHNSRRSQLAQVWAKIASEYYGVKQELLQTYSGGTEVTACNARTITALSRVGFSVVSDGSATNPQYTLNTLNNTPLQLFSKKYNSEYNPTKGFAAVMVCSQADETCPFISGCEKRISLGYVDPKRSDGTADEAATYDETSKEIAREMLYVFSGLTPQN